MLKNAQNDPHMSEPKTLHCSALILLGWFTNSVTRFRLGDAYRAHAYADDTGGSFPLTIGIVLAERLLDMALVFLLLTLATLFLAAMLSVGLAGIILIMGVFRSRLARFLPGPLKGAYQRFYEGTLESFRRLPLVTILGLLGWMAEVGRLFFVAEALGLPLGMPLVIFVTLGSAMLTLVPITPGGLGAVEWGLRTLDVVANNRHGNGRFLHSCP